MLYADQASQSSRSIFDQFKVRRKLIETDSDHNEPRNAIRKRNKTQQSGLELFPSEKYGSHDQGIKQEQKRLYGQRRHSQRDELFQVKQDIIQLQEELARRKRDQKMYKFKIKKKDHKEIKINPSTIEHDEDNLTQSTIISKLYHNNLWKFPDLKPTKELPKEPSKKIYRVKPKVRKFTFDTDYDQLIQPRGNSVNIKRFKASRVNKPLAISRLFTNRQLMKKFRKYVHAIFFTIKLRKFNQRMRKKRLIRFRSFIKQDLNTKLQALKSLIIKHCRPFFLQIIDNHNFDYHLLQKDEIALKRQKIQSVIKLLNLLIKCLQKCTNQIIQAQQFTQLFYLLCKHGNYSCIEEINTCQQLNYACVSQIFGYMRCNQPLEKSSILSLVFVKIILYNIMLQPTKIELLLNRNVNPQIIYNNIRLIGTVMYEIMIDIQDRLFQQTPLSYKLGNWVNLKGKFDFRISESMSIKEGFYKKNQLVSGLASHNYIQQIYRTKHLATESQALRQLLNKLHQSIVNYHLKVRIQTFVM